MAQCLGGAVNDMRSSFSSFRARLEAIAPGNVTTSETTPTTVYDRLYVEVREPTGALLATPATLSSLNKAALGVFTQRSVRLAAWKGQTVRVQFRVTTDGLRATGFRVDDVSLR